MSASSRTTKGPTTQALQKTLNKTKATTQVQTLFIPEFR